MSRNAFFLFFFLFVVFFLGFSGCTSQRGDDGTSDDSEKVDASCTLAADCEAKDLGHERCLGNWNCVDRICQWGCQQGDENKITLQAEPTHGDAPLSVVFTASVHLDSEEDERRFYCPSFAWDFGDGDGYAAMPSCIPYQPGVAVTPTEHGQTHIYKRPGTFIATFTLNDIMTNNVTITVPVVHPDFACETNEDCTPQGCAGQICAKNGANIFTTCEAQSWYSCLPLNHCGCVEGVCQFDDNDAFKGCVAEKISQVDGPIPLIS